MIRHEFENNMNWLGFILPYYKKNGTIEWWG